ncbi:MAG TPA: methyltransferase domain-containing protein [Candidatus Binataceae bacterium]|nr:methyltransferase domain-containing protein [Candidatus Binataceae bacterium]
METGDRNGVLMRGVGRWFVFSRLRAWFGIALETPRLLRGTAIPRGATCLDLAAGLGWAGAGLLRREPLAEVVAVDYDETILPRTRDYLRSRTAGQRTAICRADAKHLPFRTGSFHVVICLYGLHHCRGYLDALREIARVLKPGGTLALVDPVRKAGKAPKGHHGTEVPTVEELQRMLAAAGFEPGAPRVAMGTARLVVSKA